MSFHPHQKIAIHRTRVPSPPPEDDHPLHEYPQDDSSRQSPPTGERPEIETFTITPPCDGDFPDMDEPSFLSTSVSILPPPVPSLQVLHHNRQPRWHAVPPASAWIRHNPRVLSKMTIMLTNNQKHTAKEEGRARAYQSTRKSRAVT